MRRRNMLLAILIITIILLVAGAVFFREQILLAVGDYLVIQDELKPAEVIHVIAGNDYRTDYAIHLYKQGYAKVIFFTGGWCASHGYYHGKHGEQAALTGGVPQAAIAYDDTPVTSTYDEAIQLKTWIDQNPTPIRSVIVVSDPFHMRRTRWIYRLVLGKEVEIIMAPVPFEQTMYERQWWGNLASTLYVKDEYIKILYYFIRYKIGVGPIREWLASLDND